MQADQIHNTIAEEVSRAETSAISGEAASSSRRLKYLLEFAAFRAFEALGSALPLGFAVGLSGSLWHAVAPHLHRHQRADRQLALLMPDLSERERDLILKDMWRGLGETFMEALLLKKMAAVPDRIELDDAARDAIARTIAEGGIIAVPHFGNWELATIPLARAGAFHASVYRRISNPLVETHILKIRQPLFSGGLFVKGDAAAGRLMRHVKRGGSAAVMADLRDDSDCLVPFFGRLAPTTRFPAMLARMFNRPLFAACLVRISPLRFRLQVQEIEQNTTDNRDSDILESTARIQKTFENWIRERPEQWMWATRRFNE